MNISDDIQDRKIKVEKGRVIVTEVKELMVTDSENINDLKEKLKAELGNIIRNVKRLKGRANEVKGLLMEIEEQESTKEL